MWRDSDDGRILLKLNLIWTFRTLQRRRRPETRSGSESAFSQNSDKINPMKRCGSGQTHLVGQVQVGLGVAHGDDDGQIPVLAGDVQRRVSMAILPVQLAVVFEEAADDVQLTAAHGQVQGGVAILQRRACRGQAPPTGCFPWKRSLNVPVCSLELAKQV